MEDKRAKRSSRRAAPADQPTFLNAAHLAPYRHPQEPALSCLHPYFPPRANAPTHTHFTDTVSFRCFHSPSPHLLPSPRIHPAPSIDSLPSTRLGPAPIHPRPRPIGTPLSIHNSTHCPLPTFSPTTLAPRHLSPQPTVPTILAVKQNYPKQNISSDDCSKPTVWRSKVARMKSPAEAMKVACREQHDA